MTSINQFCLWLEQTALSETIRSIAWFVPAVQTVHILAIATVIGAVLMLSLRLLALVGHPTRPPVGGRPPPCRGRYMEPAAPVESPAIFLRRAGLRRLIASSLAACWLSATAPIALAQEDAIPPAKDTIFARKIVMGTIDMNMDEVETMLTPGGKLDQTEAREHLDIISVLLMAFPHMFPAATNQWKPGVDRDAALDTFAAPELWASFGDFYKRATAASKLAFDASRAKTVGELKPLVAELRTACNACHASYLKAQ